MATVRERVLAILGGFPEVAVDGDQHLRFQVRGRTFAYHLVDHHGDRREALHLKAAPGAQAALVAEDPARFFVPPYLGARGWVGLHLDTGDVDWRELTDLATDAYRLTAPERLIATLPP